MTTIAYRDGVLAADTRCMRGSVVMPELADKIFPSACGAIFGVSGDFEPAARWIDRACRSSIAAPGDFDLGLETSILVIRANRVMSIWRGAAAVSLMVPFYAIGSGKAAALGALYAGATAEEAVEIAKLIDPYTGGEVRTVKLGDRP